MAYSLLAHTRNQPSGNNNGITTSAIDTTGADLIVLVVNGYKGFVNDTITPTDSASNTWTGLTSKTGASVSYVRIFYCHAPTTSATHTFSWHAGSSTAGGIAVLAFSGSATSPFDVQNGATNSASLTIQPGSITPSVANALVVTGDCTSDNMTGTPTVDSSFLVGTSPTMTFPWVSAVTEGGLAAYLIQTSAAAVNPTWTVTGTASFDQSAVIASFLSAGGGASLTATSITLSEVLGHPAISQTHVLSGTGIHTAPVLGSPTITQNQALTAQSLTGAKPVLGTPTAASGATALTANSIIVRPIFSTPDIGPLPTAVFRGAPVWWRGWPFDEEEEEKPDVVNEIIEVPETPHETPTEDVVIARAKTIGVRLTPIQYDQVISRTLESMRDDLKAMRREGRSMREAQDRVEREIRKRAKRLKEDEEMMLLS